jgi:parallel beta helix pectate lyase-like protein
MRTLTQIEPRIPISSLPFAITQAGSYYLTTNLSGTSGISISSGNVTLDLAGFTLAGLSGSGHGIQATATLTDVRIRNGIVRDWSGTGLNLGQVTNARVEALTATNNGGDAVIVGSGSQVVDIIGSENGSAGIEAGDDCQITGCMTHLNFLGVTAGNGCTITHCTTNSNTQGGIVIGMGGSVLGCVSQFNLSNGITMGDGCTISQCSARQNSAYGIFSGSGSDLGECTSSSNGSDGISAGGFSSVHSCTAFGNSGNGITLLNGAMAAGCTVTFNQQTGVSAHFGCDISKCVVRNQTGDGIQANSSCRILDNICDSNHYGIHTVGGAQGCRVEGNHIVSSGAIGIFVEGIRNVIVRNTSGLNASADFIIAANNKVGVVFPAVDSLFFSGSDGRGITNIGTTDPWANLTY